MKAPTVSQAREARSKLYRIGLTPISVGVVLIIEDEYFKDLQISLQTPSNETPDAYYSEAILCDLEDAGVLLTDDTLVDDDGYFLIPGYHLDNALFRVFEKSSNIIDSKIQSLKLASRINLARKKHQLNKIFQLGA